MNTDKTNDLNQYLTFQIEEELYALEISKVREILDFIKVTRVPRTPDFMRGVINMRGSVVPVVDLKLKFGLGKTDKTVDTCIVIVEIEIDKELTILGILADSVQEVLELGSTQIEPAPKIGARLNTEFIKGMGKHGEAFLMILDLDKIFTLEEISVIQESTDEHGEKTADAKIPESVEAAA